MIGSLRGALIDRSLSGEVIVEVGGIGYTVTVTPATLAALGPTAREVFLFVCHVVREDDETLYGFFTRDEREAFKALLGAQGVGPALAMAVLGELEPIVLRQVVAAGDVDALCRVKGVGKKTAARMVIDLKSRLDLPDGDLAGVVADGFGGAGSVVSSNHADVRAALSNLGYSNDEIKVAVAGLPADGETAALLKQALVGLGR
jgi:Holliday junction DNA helicase RuvA